MFIVEANTNRIGTCKKVGFGGGTLWIHVKGFFLGGGYHIYVYHSTSNIRSNISNNNSKRYRAPASAGGGRSTRIGHGK